MSALADQQRPGAADAAAVERAAVGMLAVSVLVVAVVERAGGRLHPQHVIDHLDGVLDARVSCAAQPEPHQVGEIQADQRRGQNQLAVAVAQLHASGPDRPSDARGRCARSSRPRPACFASAVSCDVAPGFQPLVPVIRQAIRHRRALTRCKPRRCGNQRADRDRERERADARVLLPAVLFAGGSGARDEADRGAHHLPRCRAAPPRLARAAWRPAGSETRPHRAACRSRTARRSGNSSAASGHRAAATQSGGQDMTRIGPLIGGQQGERRERRIARPYQVIAAKRIGAVAPGHAQAGDHGARDSCDPRESSSTAADSSAGVAQARRRAAASAAARPRRARPAGTRRAAHRIRRPAPCAPACSAPRADCREAQRQHAADSGAFAGERHGAIVCAGETRRSGRRADSGPASRRSAPT